MLIMMAMPKKIKKRLVKNRPLFWVLQCLGWLLIGLIGLAIGHKFFEKSSWEVAVWMSWETLSTVGYGDYPAQTTAGRALTMIIGTFNIIIMSGVVGGTIAWFENIQYKRRSGFMNNPYKNFHLLVHFPGVQRTLTYVREVLNVEPDATFCIVDNTLEELPSVIQECGEIHFVRGSMLDEDVRKRVNAKLAKVAIVFPGSSDIETDAITKAVVDLIFKEVSDKTRVMHVLRDGRNKLLFEGSQSAQVLDYLEVLALVQEGNDQHTAAVVEQLLRNTVGANPHTVDVNKSIGMTWSELQDKANKVARDLKINVNLLALIRNREIDLCPDPDYVLTEGDQLSVITKGIKWDVFERRLAEI